MDVNYQPSFTITANDSDITAIVLDRFTSVTLVDETGDNADTLEVVLADHDPAAPIAIPPTGAELTLSLGYGASVTKKGVFVCDKVSITGWPQTMTIRATAAPWDETPKGKVDFQSHKTRSWAAGTTIGAMVQKMAKEHGMGSVVSAEMASIKLPHISQSEESDMNLLVRLAKKYDAIAKPAGGKIIFTKRGAATTASGADLPVVKVLASECSAFRMDQTTRESAGTVVAYWHAKRSAKRVEVTAGGGEPVKRIKQYFPTQEMAQAAAQAELDRRSRGGYTLSINIPGDPKLTAECVLDLANFRPGVNGSWLIKRVEHVLAKDRGYRCIVDCERPNDAVVLKVAAKRATVTTTAAPAPATATAAAPTQTAAPTLAQATPGLTKLEKKTQLDAINNDSAAKVQQMIDLHKKGDEAKAAGDVDGSIAYYKQALAINEQAKANNDKVNALLKAPTVD